MCYRVLLFKCYCRLQKQTTESLHGKLCNLGRRDSEKENNNYPDQYLNIDKLPEGGLQVKFVYITNSGNIVIRITRRGNTKCLVRQICDKKMACHS